MKKKAKEEAEVDPNSVFNKLKKLQTTLKEEIALTDTFFENRDDLLKKIESNCYEYYKQRISMQEIFAHYKDTDQKEQVNNKKIKFEVSEKPQSELPQCFDIVYKLLFYFRNSKSLTLKLIELVEEFQKDQSELLANFLCNHFYVNILSSNNLNEHLLTLIFLLIDKELDRKIHHPESGFLDVKDSFIMIFLKNLSRRDDIKTFLENILKKFLIGTASILPNQKNQNFFGMEISRIKEHLNQKKYGLPRTQKMAENYNEILTMDIKKSKLNINLVNQKNKKENKNLDDDDIILTKDEIENNFYVQATKESFDDLLLGKEDDDDEFDMLNEDDESDNRRMKKLMDIAGGGGSYKIKKGGKDDIENFLIDSGFYNRPISKDNKDQEKYEEEKMEREQFIEKNRDKLFNNLYRKDLNRETLLSLIEDQTDDDMEEYLMGKVKDIQGTHDGKDGMDFTNKNLLNQILKNNETKTYNEKLILIYKYDFQVARKYIDDLIYSLIKNKENTPYLIRAICTIISKLVAIKFPEFTNLQRIQYMSAFLFMGLILPIIYRPDYNGIMMFNFRDEKDNAENEADEQKADKNEKAEKSQKNPKGEKGEKSEKKEKGEKKDKKEKIEKSEKNEKKEVTQTQNKKVEHLRVQKIVEILKIFKKLFRYEFFDSKKQNEAKFTIFNSYFIEIMPHIIEYFRAISNTKLPTHIEKMLEAKRTNSSEDMNIEFDFLKSHLEEKLEHQSICITWTEFNTIYQALLKGEENKKPIITENDGIIYKTYKKMSFHTKTLENKIKNDINNNKRTYIYLTKLICDDELKEKIEAKKDKKFSFQTSEDLSDSNNEAFILTRVKYCINTIMKHLNELSRTNFNIDEKQTTKNFVKSLNKLINLEGFSDMLKEKDLPLEWFGLYLESNFEGIPLEYKKNNFEKLYSELINESLKNLKKIQEDNSLNIIYSKIINSEKMIDISKNNLKKIRINEKKFEILEFILRAKIPIIMTVERDTDKTIKQIEIEKYNIEQVKPITSKSEKNKQNLNNQDKQLRTEYKCNNIIEFCQNFPYIGENDIDILEREEQICLSKTLNSYFSIIQEAVQNESNFKENFDQNSQIKIQIQIEDFIHAQLYEKIYSEMAGQDDIAIFQKCFRLKWLKPYMLDKKITYLDEKMILMMKNFVEGMDKEISPNNKLREFEKLDILVRNMMTLYGYPDDVYLQIMSFAIIKGQPLQLDSSYKYISMYYSEKIPEKSGLDLLVQYEKLLDIIKNFSAKQLVNITEEQFNTYNENVVLSLMSQESKNN